MSIEEALRPMPPTLMLACVRVCEPLKAYKTVRLGCVRAYEPKSYMKIWPKIEKMKLYTSSYPHLWLKKP